MKRLIRLSKLTDKQKDIVKDIKNFIVTFAGNTKPALANNDQYIDLMQNLAEVINKKDNYV